MQKINLNFYIVKVSTEHQWAGQTFKVNHGTYRSGELVSGTLTTALYLGEFRTGTNAGRAGRWVQRRTQLGIWEREARDGKKEGK